jgi:hypothetical protein
LAKKNNFSKKTDNKKNIIIITCAIISISVLSLTFAMNSETLPETTVSLPEKSNSMSNYLQSMSNTHIFQVELGSPFFETYVTKYDFDHKIDNQIIPLQGVRLELVDLGNSVLTDSLKPNDGSVVIYPVFTSAAYQEPGFYTYFRGECDESCITDLSFENPEFQYTSSGLTAQILYHVGYDFLTDIEVDQNPELLQNYDTVILLHNEYLTKKAFDAITSHPNLIFLAPNALYAEIDVNYDDNTMTLIRGHQYPPPEKPANGFDYEIEQRFHKYEYDDKCLEWEFIEIENGFHLNCYPDGIIYKNLDILLKMKEL